MSTSERDLINKALPAFVSAPPPASVRTASATTACGSKERRGLL